jgi:hypothetical protein
MNSPANLVPWNHVNIDVSDEPTYNPPLYGLIILRAGTVSYRTEAGETVTRTLPTPNDGMDGEGGSYPFTLWGRIDKIFDETDLADGDLIGISGTGKQ